MCLSKGLTGGFLPMSAVLTTEQIFECFLSPQRNRGFLHSHSYTGNPLGCAAALASLAIFSSDDVINKNIKIAEQLRRLSTQLATHPNIAQVRQTGMIIAFEMQQTNKTPFPIEQRRGLHAYRAGLAQGAVLRPLGDVLYWMPPYCISATECEFLYDATAIAIDEACV
jgi:adenosylmethionine---8-amino-7-oxononanoate aminotransferase